MSTETETRTLLESAPTSTLSGVYLSVYGKWAHKQLVNQNLSVAKFRTNVIATLLRENSRLDLGLLTEDSDSVEVQELSKLLLG